MKEARTKYFEMAEEECWNEAQDEEIKTSQFTYRLETGRKLTFGVLIVIGISFSWVGASQFTENTYTKTFNAPAFMMWFSTSWMSVSYLPVIIVSILFKRSIVASYRLINLICSV